MIKSLKDSLIHRITIKSFVGGKAHTRPQKQKQLAAVYALGIRDGLQIAADIRRKTSAHKEDAS